MTTPDATIFGSYPDSAAAWRPLPLWSYHFATSASPPPAAARSAVESTTPLTLKPMSVSVLPTFTWMHGPAYSGLILWTPNAKKAPRPKASSGTGLTSPGSVTPRLHTLVMGLLVLPPARCTVAVFAGAIWLGLMARSASRRVSRSPSVTVFAACRCGPVADATQELTPVTASTAAAPRAVSSERYTPAPYTPRSTPSCPHACRFPSALTVAAHWYALRTGLTSGSSVSGGPE